MNVTDEDGRVVGKVTSVTSDDTGIDVEAELFAEAAALQKRLAARRVDDLIIGGASDAAEILANPSLQERTAMEAVARVMGVGGPRTAPQPGAARRKPPKVSARKRTKAARRRNR